MNIRHNPAIAAQEGRVLHLKSFCGDTGRLSGPDGKDSSGVSGVCIWHFPSL